MHDRSATIKLDGKSGKPFMLTQGLPQGSPVSLCLFMLYIQPIFHCLSPPQLKSRFGYIDDICLLAASHSLPANCETLKHEYTNLTSWACTEGLAFNTKKTDLLYLTR